MHRSGDMGFFFGRVCACHLGEGTYSLGSKVRVTGKCDPLMCEGLGDFVKQVKYQVSVLYWFPQVAVVYAGGRGGKCHPLSPLFLERSFWGML